MGKKSGKKAGKKAEVNKEILSLRITGRPARILQCAYALSEGKRSYSDILDEWTDYLESPTDKLIKAIDNLETVCKTNFNPDTSKMVELLRPIIIQSSKGSYDPKAFKKVILEFMKSQKRKNDG